jgi:hypothetical protein
MNHQDRHPWAWFDVDDVVVDATPLFQESMDRWKGTVIPWQTWAHNHFPHFYGIMDDDAEGIAQMKEVWRRDQILERAPVRAGVVAVLHRVKALGCRIGFLTARGWHEDSVAITQKVADQNALPVDRILSIPYAHSKAETLAATGTRVVGFVDDTPRHVEGCVAAGLNAMLLTQPWNVQAVHLPRVAHLDEFADRIALALQGEPPRPTHRRTINRPGP